MGVDLNDRSSKDPIAVINVTPLVDVCLVLVIIFMVTAPLIAQNGIRVNSIKKEVGAGATSEPAPEAAEIIFVKLTPAGIYLNESLLDLQSFKTKLKDTLDRDQEKTVYITAEGLVLYGQVVKILDVSRQCGAQRLAVLNDKEGMLEKALALNKN